jgi:hypothetical protein
VFSRPILPSVLRSISKTRRPAQIVYVPANLASVFLRPQGAHSST